MDKISILYSGNPVLTIILILIISVILLYIARKPAHELIKSIFHMAHKALRLSARSTMLAEKRMASRNREVLLSVGEEAVERVIEREFHRVEAVVRRDLSGYPTLQQALKTQIAKIEEDYSKSADAPPAPPGWVHAVEAVAKIPPSGDTLISNMLGAINQSIEKQYKNVLSDYRKACAERHSLLKKMMPFWRQMSNTLSEVDKTIASILERAKVIDAKMDFYENIRKGSEKAVRMLSSSSLTQFFIAGLVMLIAIGGAVINFNLIALPMSEMVGGGSYIGPFKTSNVAAMVIILVEAAMGLFLMESLHITKLFPIIGAMDDKMRHKMIWITFSILFILAGIESSLAYMRDMIAADMQALRQSLAEVTVSPEQSGNWIPTVGQMIMGFILPFALAFIAIPLESFVHSSRTVLGVAVVGMLRSIAYILRLTGNISRSLGEMLIRVYDLFIFAPLWIEGLLKKDGKSEGKIKTVKPVKEEKIA
ncbi:MAG: YwqI/YxiC family protein [Deltaproteobacteria bacterium]|nr:YwqI/YxiC family protein [Deltaproteobacteria bacterium]